MTTTHLLATRGASARFDWRWIVTITAFINGCAQNPPAAAPAPAIEPLQQYMQRAGEASLQGSKDRARELYYAAAKTYPTSKEPWLKLAQDHFENRNYGQAILAAQEVLLRDPGDSVATSILAVSGLRVSAAGLSAMRQQQSRLNGDTRSEAEDIVKKLRELLGEPVLVPANAGTATGASGAAPVVRPRPIRPRPVPASSTPAPMPATAPAPQKGEAPTNPFNVLTK